MIWVPIVALTIFGFSKNWQYALVAIGVTMFIAGMIWLASEHE